MGASHLDISVRLGNLDRSGSEFADCFIYIHAVLVLLSGVLSEQVNGTRASVARVEAHRSKDR